MVHQIYAGKAKEMWTTEDEDVLRVVYLDQATALNGKKKDHINDKGKTNNAISTLIFKYFEANGIETHFIKRISDTEELVKKVKIIPLEMITRNYSAGHFASRYGVEEGKKFETPVEEMCLKSDELDDPAINASQAIALGIVTQSQLDTMWAISRKVDQLLTPLFEKAGMQLIDFKLEFGTLPNGKVILADEFSPDNCRLWDTKTHHHLDKDVYRKDLGELTPVYQEVLQRLEKVISL